MNDPQSPAAQYKRRCEESQREQTPLKTCPKHPRAGSFDGRCPACDAELDFLRLTQDMNNASVS